MQFSLELEYLQSELVPEQFSVRSEANQLRT